MNAGHRLVLLLGIAALVAGCAVLNIDVDIYKGPLANHPSVQTEQLAAMAMGAKPLLAQLRYALELNECRRLFRLDRPASLGEPGTIEPDHEGLTTTKVCPNWLGAVSE